MIEGAGQVCQRCFEWRILGTGHHISKMRITAAAAAATLVCATVLILAKGFQQAEVSDPEPEAQFQGGNSHPEVDESDTNRAAIRKRLVDSNTYLGFALATDDSVLKRWRDQSGRWLNVHISVGTVAGYDPQFSVAVRRAFDRWQRVGGIPVPFMYVRDSVGADVHVYWVESFSAEKLGEAEVAWDWEGWMVDGTLRMATRSPGGRSLSPDVVYVIALHEIGHLLGLGHSDDPADLMYPTPTARDLTVRDRRSARLLYALPPGSVKN